jgi:hypothetical protein
VNPFTLFWSLKSEMKVLYRLDAILGESYIHPKTNGISEPDSVREFVGGVAIIGGRLTICEISKTDAKLTS